MGHVHWSDGSRFDPAEIGARARAVGAALIIDGTQSVGALPFDVRALFPDALICAGYKWLMGPYGIGLA
jgi:selenocysteine lyase/cysteine desulfurase